MKKLSFLFGLALLCSAGPTLAQGIPSEGKDFYLGYLHPSYNNVVPGQTAGFFRVYALVSSFQDNVISVSYFDPLTKKEDYPQNYYVVARKTTQVPLDRTRMKMNDPGDIAGEFKSCHITSKKPFNIQFFSTGANSGGSYLALPVNGWGKQYVVASYNDNGSLQGGISGGDAPTLLDRGAGTFVIIAAYDNTEVTIIPTALTGGGHVGVHQGAGSTGTPRPYTVGLNRGQCWLVKSKSASQDEQDDISASIVKASKPVAVIAGHEDAMTGNGSTGGRNTEGRDFMIEQMIPTEFWDKTGYITIPMVDSPGSDTTGQGDNFRTYVYDEKSPETINVNRGGSTLFLQDPTPYAQPYEVRNATAPTHFFADSGVFMVMQYDLRNHGYDAPYPAPNMMSIVPRSMWRNAYLWYVPAKINEKIESHFVTVIGLKDGVTFNGKKANWYADSIKVSKNGSTLTKIGNALGVPLKVWSTIPDFPELQALTYKVSPGTSYYMNAPYPIMTYHFGSMGLSYDGYLGDFSGDDYYLSYALPGGMALSKAIPRRMGIKVDTLCSGWRVCALDSNNPGGIKSVTLLDDPYGDIIPGKNYVYKNTSFDPKDDPLNLKQITPDPAPAELCFNVRVDNPGQDAYAPIQIVDLGGNSFIVELRYKKAAVEFVPNDSVGLVFKTTEPPRDTINSIYRPYVGEEVCKEYIFINKPESPRSFTITKVDLPVPSKFRITSVVPPVGSLVKAGDTLRIGVCFTGPDTLLYLDSIDFETDCFPVRLPLQGQAGTGLIVADDHDFGTVLIGTQKCSNIEVKNVGNKPFTLTPDYILNNFGEFTFLINDPKNALPLTLGPGQSHRFNFCYLPNGQGSDSARMDWGTDIREPYTGDIKSYSDLWGKGIMPGVNWDRVVQEFRADSMAEFFWRVNLVNTGTADAQLTGIWIDGPDADEFRIVTTENGTNPPSYRGTVLNVGDTMWVDVAFKIDLTKTPITRIRTAYLRTSAMLDSANIRTIALSGGFGLAKVHANSDASKIQLHPNPAHDRITLDVELEQTTDVSVAIYDVLGREMVERTFRGQQIGANSYTLDLQKLAAGTYVVVVRAGEFSEAKQVIIE